MLQYGASIDPVTQLIQSWYLSERECFELFGLNLSQLDELLRIVREFRPTSFETLNGPLTRTAIKLILQLLQYFGA